MLRRSIKFETFLLKRLTQKHRPLLEFVKYKLSLINESKNILTHVYLFYQQGYLSSRSLASNAQYAIMNYQFSISPLINYKLLCLTGIPWNWDWKNLKAQLDFAPQLLLGEINFICKSNHPAKMVITQKRLLKAKCKDSSSKTKEVVFYNNMKWHNIKF